MPAATASRVSAGHRAFCTHCAATGRCSAIRTAPAVIDSACGASTRPDKANGAAKPGMPNTANAAGRAASAVSTPSTAAPIAAPPSPSRTAAAAALPRPTASSAETWRITARSNPMRDAVAPSEIHVRHRKNNPASSAPSRRAARTYRPNLPATSTPRTAKPAPDRTSTSSGVCFSRCCTPVMLIRVDTLPAISYTLA